MRRTAAGMIMASVAASPALGVPPPPSISAPHAAPSADRERLLLVWAPGEASCEGAAVASISPPRPLNDLVWTTTRLTEPVSYRFTVDPQGRPLSIARVGEEGVRHADDLAPALAASRFEAGAARSGCTITFTPVTASLDAAPVAELVAYTMNRHSTRLPREGWDRIAEGGNCTQNPRPAPLVRAYPDFKELPATPGARDWALVEYDLDAAGTPVNEHVVASTGNAALEKASIAAVADSRFTSGARQGCLYPYWRAPDVLPPPPMPPKGALKPADAACEGKDGFAEPLRLVFPEAYRRRSIEGWAIVSYDVASWGEIGNVEVLEAQPTEDFGERAAQIMQSAKVETPGEGMTGCTDRVRFKINKGAGNEGPGDRVY